MIGSGVVGLTSARELQRRGFDVTIYAASLPPDTTSNMSLAGWTPTSGLAQFDQRTPMNDVVNFGGKVVVRPESVVVNCTGLGSKALFGDPQLVPLKGQRVILVPQPEITYGTSGGSRSAASEPGVGIHMMPRLDGIALGGTSERDVWTMDVNEKERLRVVNGHIELFTSMGTHT